MKKCLKKSEKYLILEKKKRTGYPFYNSGSSCEHLVFKKQHVPKINQPHLTVKRETFLYVKMNNQKHTTHKQEKYLSYHSSASNKWMPFWRLET